MSYVYRVGLRDEEDGSRVLQIADSRVVAADENRPKGHFTWQSRDTEMMKKNRYHKHEIDCSQPSSDL